jgi:hypothetical protein
VLVNGKKYAFTFRNGNTFIYEMVNKDADNGYGFCVKNSRGQLEWFSKIHVTTIKEVN